MSLWSLIERRLQDLAGELYPDDFRAALAAAGGELEAGNPTRAAEALEQLVAERPDHAGALALLGAARLELGQLAEAIRAFDRAAERASDRADVYLGRGEARLRQADAAGAVGDFRLAMASAAGDRAVLAAAYRGMGFGHRMAGDVDRAKRELRKAVAEEPDDAGALAALGDILLAAPDRARAEARRHLRHAAEQDRQPLLTWLALGRLDLAEGDPAAARGWFERAAEAAHARGPVRVPPDDAGALADALAGLADAALDFGEVDAARRHLEEAVAAAPERADLGGKLGDALAASGRHAEALGSYQAALLGGAGVGVRRRALAAALAVGDLAAALPLAARVLEDDPGDPQALVARGRAIYRAGQEGEAEDLFRTALERDAGPGASIALAELELGRAAPDRASAWALRALASAPRDPQARGLLERARAAELAIAPAGPRDPGALYEVSEELRRLCAARAELADLAGEAARAGSDFDQPLLVTVMGEFSSGKSTFVNAFIGEEVAPTGITPTTATINVVKYGRERGGRVIHRDGRTETLGWDDLFGALQRLDASAARGIHLVEILVPVEALTRVNLVDTPGLNSILPEHEQVAREFIGRADAVVWLFSSQQAGKASERRALRELADEGVRVLGVLNKVDQIASGERAALGRHLTRELEDLIEEVVPLSARAAVDSRGQDPAWRQLLAALEERFFSHAREIKHQVLARRLERLRAGAAARVGRAIEEARAGAERRQLGAGRARAERGVFVDQVVTRERRRIGEAAAHLYRDAAREVLELVIPRRLPFGSHKTSRADRDYLVSLLDGGFAALLEQSQRRVEADLRRTAGEALGLADPGGAPILAEAERALSDSIDILGAQVYARTLAYLRGHLEGGTVDSFFRRELPRIDLEEDAVYHALYRDSPDLDAAIALPLAEAGCAALERLEGALQRLAGGDEVRAFDLEVGIGRALAGLGSRIAEARA